jgi:hypothetical protein
MIMQQGNFDVAQRPAEEHNAGRCNHRHSAEDSAWLRLSHF